MTILDVLSQTLEAVHVLEMGSGDALLEKTTPLCKFSKQLPKKKNKFIMLACLSIHPSICVEQLGSHRTIFVKFYVGSSFTNISDHSQV